MVSVRLTRRKLLGTAAMGVLAVTCPAVMAAGSPVPPNIVFIMADDLGFADLSCYGRPDYSTPHIDRLAQEGVKFTQAYANSPVCSATRTALATGRYQYRLPVGLEEPLTGPAQQRVGLPPEHPTLPSLLRDAGYATALVGKWHLGGLPNYGPLQSGYQQFYGVRGGSVDYFSYIGTSGNRDLWDNDVPAHDTGYLTHALGERATEFIARQAAEGMPFLLSLHFTAPHWPWEGPDDQDESARLGTRINRRDSGTMEIYAAIMKALDDEVGRVAKALDDHGLRDNTIVIFTSDNGGERFSYTWPLSGQKTELLEGGIRVPVIVRWPGVVPPASVSEQTIMTMDWLPTFLAAAGQLPADDCPSDGIDLGPFLRDPGLTVERELFWRYKANRQRAVRHGRWKYLKILDNTFLFDLVTDPRERANLKERHPETFARLEARWREWNATMLPQQDSTFTDGLSGVSQADHVGTPPTDGQADDGL